MEDLIQNFTSAKEATWFNSFAKLHLTLKDQPELQILNELYLESQWLKIVEQSPWAAM